MRALRDRGWLVLVLAAALTPVVGLFTFHRIFFVRDLGLFFWSRHLWLRHTLHAGVFPLWDLHVAAGQSAIADALNQLLMPLTLAVRLLPSDIVSFNLWVALPLPLGASGTWLFLRREHAPAPAALGALAFGLSGPMVSSLNAPNLSWSLALLPWVLWAVERSLDRADAVRVTVAAAAVAVQALAGEPVTLTATCVTLVVLALWPGGARVQRLWHVALCVAAGVLLAAAQLVPTMVAGVGADRGSLATPDFWSLHPLALLEAAMPHLFGNYYTAFLADMPWMSALNSGREPFYYSIYVGPLTLLLAAVGVAGRPRRTAPWVAVAAGFTVAAFGGYTPLYPLVRHLVPAFAFFRFPVKYFGISAFALAAMATHGWAAATAEGSREPVRRAAIAIGSLAAAAAAMIVAVVVFTPASLATAAALARSVHVEDVPFAAASLVRDLPPLAAYAAGAVIAGAALLVLATRPAPAARGAAYVLLAATCADLAITNGDLNPTSPVENMNAPTWYRSLASEGRVYIGGRLRGYMNPDDPDGTSEWDVPTEPTAVQGRIELNALLPMMPSGWDVREALSYDLPVLWPAEYQAVTRRFERAIGTERDAFIRRAGIRWCVLPDDRQGVRAIATVPPWHMAVFECNPGAARTFFTDRAHAGADETWQREALFDPALPDDDLRMPRLPRVSGRPGAPVARAVLVTTERPNALTLDASLDREAFLVLRDSYDPSWDVRVDDDEADVVRANGIYRAIRLPAGRHVIRFEYRPRAFVAGLILSGSTSLVLGIAVAVSSFRRRRGGAAEAGFTLVELMIVISIIGILLALAFARFSNMRSTGDEASAVASLRSIVAAEWQFAQTCGNQKYAPTLVALGQPVPATGQAFLGPEFTSAEVIRHSGYDFHLAGKPVEGAPPACNGAPVSAGFAATADPATLGSSGSRFFAVNADRVLYEDPKDTFTDKMPESGAAPHGTELK